uniref:Uncharacterized protein n=1 Tax=Anguilla anguilla TaxID=7936 RepID=A0A0E9S3F4_ANGAN
MEAEAPSGAYKLCTAMNHSLSHNTAVA